MLGRAYPFARKRQSKAQGTHPLCTGAVQVLLPPGCLYDEKVQQGTQKGHSPRRQTLKNMFGL